jgi:hypothetical protein
MFGVAVICCSYLFVFFFVAAGGISVYGLFGLTGQSVESLESVDLLSLRRLLFVYGLLGLGGLISGTVLLVLIVRRLLFSADVLLSTDFRDF